MKKSNIHQYFLDMKIDLMKQLNDVNEYLQDGTATTTVTFVNARGKVITTKQIKSNWTTAIGKERVKQKHQTFIKNCTKTFVQGTKNIRVDSPFVKSGQRMESATVTQSRNVEVFYQTA